MAILCKYPVDQSCSVHRNLVEIVSEVCPAASIKSVFDNESGYWQTTIDTRGEDESILVLKMPGHTIEFTRV